MYNLIKDAVSFILIAGRLGIIGIFCFRVLTLTLLVAYPTDVFKIRFLCDNVKLCLLRYKDFLPVPIMVIKRQNFQKPNKFTVTF